MVLVYEHSFTRHVDSRIKIFCIASFCIVDLLLPEVVRNCILGYACCADLFTVLDVLLRLCIYENMLIYGSLKVRQTYLIFPYSYVLTTPCTYHTAA